MALHEPFGHMEHKLWAKERPGVKNPMQKYSNFSQTFAQLFFSFFDLAPPIRFCLLLSNNN
jgi:hypothetical protein